MNAGQILASLRVLQSQAQGRYPGDQAAQDQYLGGAVRGWLSGQDYYRPGVHRVQRDQPGLIETT